MTWNCLLVSLMTFLFHILWSGSQKLCIHISHYLAKVIGQITLMCKPFTGSTDIISEVLHTVDDLKFILESSRPQSLWHWCLMMCYLLMSGIRYVCMNEVIKTPYGLSPSFNKETAADLFSGCCVIAIMYQ